MKFLLCILIVSVSTSALAFRLNTNTGAAFSKDEIKIYVTSNSTCTNAGISNEDLLSISVKAAKKYWNKIATADLKIKKGGILQTTDAKFLTGELCVKNCNAGTAVPEVSHIVIACNNNTTDNFTSSSMYALTAPVDVSSSTIKGSVILVNDSATTQFSTLSNSEIETVMAHEIGHAIGLGHTDKREALMHSEFNENRKRLAQDDIDGASYLYPNQLHGCQDLLGISLTTGVSNPPKGPGSFIKSSLIGLSIGFLMYFLMVFITNSILASRRQSLF